MSAAQRTIKLYGDETAWDDTPVATYTVTQNSTIWNIVNWINCTTSTTGVSATIENGVLTIHNGYITNATLESTMGLEWSNASSYALGSIKVHTITQTVTGVAQLSNVIAAIGNTSAVSSGYNLQFDSHSIEVNATTTIDQLIDRLTAAGADAFVDPVTGRLHVNGGTLTGSVADALGITSITVTTAVSVRNTRSPSPHTENP